MANFHDNAGRPLAPHAPAYAREYTQTLFVGVAKKVKVPWRLPGTVWLWSCRPDHVEVGVPRLDLDPAPYGEDWCGGKIPLVFPPWDAPGFKTVDVVVSAAPPEFTNARQYVLRFHLTYIDPTSHADQPEEMSAADAAERRTTKARLDELERLATAERLVRLNRECSELHAQRLASPAASFFQGSVAQSSEIAQLREELDGLNASLRSAFLPAAREAPHREPHREAPPPQSSYASYREAPPPQQAPPESSYASVQTRSVASRGRRRKPKATPMKDGWYAAYDYGVARPYYFRPGSDVVQWQPPPGQPACLVSHGKSPYREQVAATYSHQSRGPRDRVAMLESPAPSEIGD